jgi:hypothetical protein
MSSTFGSIPASPIVESVTSSSDLPTYAKEGTVAFVVNEKLPYYFNGTVWKKIFFGIPDNVRLIAANKVFFDPKQEGLIMRANDSVTQTNAAGGFNGSGAGNAGFISCPGLDNALLSTFSSMSVTARSDFPGTDLYFGQISWNVLVNFANASLPVATDFANLIIDDLPTTSYNYLPLSSAHQTFTTDSSKRAVRAVSGTGVITLTGNVSTGSATITNLSNVNALTVGMYLKQAPGQLTLTPDAGLAFPDGTTIVSINTGATSCVVSNVSATTGTGISLKQYGGVAPVSRSGTLTSGNATISGITNTADLQVNMMVTGTGIPANTRIISMVANTSITLSANATDNGSQTLSFRAAGLTGIPANTEYVGIPMSVVAANNPTAYFAKTKPITPTWTTTDGGFAKEWEHNAFNLKMGSSGTTSRAPKLVTVAKIVLNDIEYTFAQE